MSGQLILALRLTLAVSLSTVAGGAFETFASAVFDFIIFINFITCVPLPCALPPDADIVPVNCRVVVLVASILGGAILHASICVVDFPLANGLRRWWRRRRGQGRRHTSLSAPEVSRLRVLGCAVVSVDRVNSPFLVAVIVMYTAVFASATFALVCIAVAATVVTTTLATTATLASFAT